MRRSTIATLWLIGLFTWAVNLYGDDVPMPGDPISGGEEQVQGSLVIMGGAIRFEDRGIWAQIVELAGQPHASIAIIPVASSQPLESGRRVSEMLTKLGAKPFVVPLGIRNIDTDYREVVQDPEWINKVRSATGVFFTGGSQARITQAMLDSDGERTPLLDAVWDVYRRGGVIAGTSAGAAMMSQVMFAHPPASVLRTLQSGLKGGKELSRGLGFLGENWFIDQHCLVRGRFARAVMAMADKGIHYGIGVDEDTAVVVRRGVDLEVIGYKGAILLDCSEAAQDKQQPRFNIRNVKLSYLDHGDRLNLQTLVIEPAHPKLLSGKIDPSSPDFRPTSRHKLFTNDILGNTTVVELMSELLFNANPEALGMAFDGAAAATSDEESEGFEFRLYKHSDTHGWHSDVRGCDSFTVANIRLDVRPIAIKGRLYRYTEPEIAEPAVSEEEPTTTASATSTDARPTAATNATLSR